MKRNFFLIYLVVLFFLLDRLIKHFLIKNVAFKERFFSFGPIGFYKNTGVAFGVDLPASLIIVLIITILIGLLIWFYQSIVHRPELLPAIVLIIGGAISNLIDRLRYGFVVDYINLKVWPIFNLADVMIVGGVVWFGYIEWRKDSARGKLLK